MGRTGLCPRAARQVVPEQSPLARRHAFVRPASPFAIARRQGANLKPGDGHQATRAYEPVDDRADHPCDAAETERLVASPAILVRMEAIRLGSEQQSVPVFRMGGK